MSAATDIEGRTPLVTGAASGIGLAIARGPGAWALIGSGFAVDAGQLAH